MSNTSNTSNAKQQSAQEDQPGSGWSNGALAPQMFGSSSEGRLQRYSERRWIGLSQGWTRIGGENATELDARHSQSQALSNGAVAETRDSQARAVRNLIAQLCETFYRQGWATGTGGGVSIRVKCPQNNHSWRVFVAPSGIQKEDMIGDDIFELDMERNVVNPPKTVGLRQSACTPLWYVVYRLRPHVTSVIHTHSMYAQLATLLEGDSASVLRITHLEMLKGVGHHAYDDVLEIPIIDNRPSEDLLAQQLEMALNKYPECNAVLVRRHGIYVWGDTWEQAKTQCESFDYLCQAAVEMKRMGLDPGQIPVSGTYRVNEKESNSEAAAAQPATKRAKLESKDFRGVSQTDNAVDLQSSRVPLIPRDCPHIIKAVVLDIEGCTTSISFVHDVLFPFARQQLQAHLQMAAPPGSEAHRTLATALAKDAAQHLPQRRDAIDNDDIVASVHALMDADVKSATLKQLQGDIWKTGYTSGELQGHVYPDFLPMLEFIQKNISANSTDDSRVKVYIYSSGSVAAQKLLFGHSVEGDLLPHIAGHFDITTSGPKKVANSYTNICQALQKENANMDSSSVLFVSDSEAEVVAARQAGLHVALTIRPGNAPLTAATQDIPKIHSLLQLCCA